jgi:predicted ArsR family transcriptional regulator
VEDDVVVVRYGELLMRIKTGETAEQVAKQLGLSPAAIIFHLHKMGLHYHRREGKWVSSI